MPDGTFVSVDRLRGKVRVSPSQLSTADCRRKWGFTRALGGRGNKYAARGSAVHDILDKWGRAQDTIDATTHYGLIAATAVDHIPPPGFMEVETAFEVETPRVIFTGRRDLVFFDNALRTTGAEQHQGLWVIGDYKTTSGFKWALTPEELSQDEQGVIYAASIFEADPRAEHVELRWIYLLDPGEHARPGAYRSKPVSVIVSREHAYKMLARMEDLALELETYDGLPPNDLPHNYRVCDAYGGCPYQSECGLTAAERMMATMAQSELQARLQANLITRGQGSAAAAPPPSAAAPKPSTGDGLTPAQRIAAIRARGQGAAAETPREQALEEIAKTKAEALDESTIISAEDAAEIRRVAAGSEKPPKTRTKAPAPAPSERRDLFAAAALTGLLARGTNGAHASVVGMAYEIADLMIASE